ncbi:undecaprenyldiphospho-muramoylpentapeptide beta-N-acetylglucosaminyltransferase [Verrucomicrobia bacterium LW23]|nr:undecaprenyldiphospho-muramoylpentapeptide beta-N-acetylglucosaminyltransferase [Verrucomicrobia bacterium LW23]
MKLRVAIACGGTGGHLFPGIAVAEELQQRGHETLLLVSSKQIDAVALQGNEQHKSRAISTLGWPGLSPRLFSFLYTLYKSWGECRGIFNEFKPDMVLGMGGFTSAVPLMLGRTKKLQTFIHESNAIPGRVTRYIAPRVTRTLLGFSRCANHLRTAQCIVTGTPVRKGLAQLNRAEVAEKFGLNPNAKTLLVMGGSQGARGINEMIVQMLPLIGNRRDDWQFLHLSGPSDANLVEVNYRRQKLTAVVQPFSSEMEQFYSLADLVVCRSGASSLTELSHYGLPSLLIPYPTAADDHQTANAHIFSDVGAAVTLPQSKLTPERLRDEVTRLFTDESARQAMSAAARKLATTNAAATVAQEMEKCAV